jgi:tripartite-type tricarboxylate transporter receptor subunit TctC
MPNLDAKALMGAVLTAVCMGAPVMAQPSSLPCSQAQLVVPWPAGGDTDVVFKAYVDSINKTGSNPSLELVYVSGQGGIKGTTQVKDAKPDGCMLLATHRYIITSELMGNSKFTHEALQPVAQVSFTPSIVGASTKAPFSNLSEMLAMAKKGPESVTVGVVLGSTSHFMFSLIEDAAKVKFRFVDYEGTVARTAGLLKDEVMLSDVNVLTAQKEIKAGAINGLAISTAERETVTPQIPTLKEQGLDIVYGLPRGVMAPLGTPAATVKFWDEAFAKAAKDPAVIAALQGAGSMVRYLDAAAYGEFLDQDYAEHKRLAQKN